MSSARRATTAPKKPQAKRKAKEAASPPSPSETTLPPRYVPRRAALPFDEVYVGNGAEQARYVAVRVGFLNALVADARVQARLTLWAAWESEAPGEISLRLIGKDVGLLVQGELKISWPFVNFELLDYYNRFRIAAFRGPQIVLGYKLSRPAPSDLNVIFTPLPGETALEAAERFEQISRATLARLQHAATPEASAPIGRPRSPNNHGKHLELWGRWYYQTHVKHPADSLRSITKAHHEKARHKRGDAWDCCGRHVRENIDTAKQILNRSRFRTPLRDA